MVERSKNHSELGHVYSICSKIIFFVLHTWAFLGEKKSGSDIISTIMYSAKFAKKIGAFLLCYLNPLSYSLRSQTLFLKKNNKKPPTTNKLKKTTQKIMHKSAQNKIAVIFVNYKSFVFHIVQRTGMRSIQFRDDFLYSQVLLLLLFQHKPYFLCSVLFLDVKQ